jgi:hypothetical protein
MKSSPPRSIVLFVLASPYLNLTCVLARGLVKCRRHLHLLGSIEPHVYSAALPVLRETEPSAMQRNGAVS